MTFPLFILYVVLAYIQPGEIMPALAPYRITYWVGMAGLAVVAVSLVERRSHLRGSLQLWAVAAFTAVMGLSLMVAERWLGAPVLAVQRFGPSLTIFVLAIVSVTSLVRLRIAATFVIALTTALMLQGAVAYHFGYNAQLFLMDRTAVLDAPEEPLAQDQADADDAPLNSDEQPEQPEEADGGGTARIRALGFMNDPNDLAMAMIVAFGLIGGAWRPTRQARHLLLGAAACALVYGIYLTRSRGGAVALVVVIWRFAAGRIGRVPALIVLVALGASLMMLDFGGRSLIVDENESATGRLDAWTEGLEMLKTQPILGVGYGQFLDHHTLTAHNSLVLSFAETGLLGCFFWVSLFVVTLLELHQVKALAGDEPFDAMARQWAEGLQLALIGFMVAAFFLSRTFAPTLYLVVGLSAAVAAIVRQANRSIPLPALPELGLLILACEAGGVGVVYTMVKLHVA